MGKITEIILLVVLIVLVVALFAISYFKKKKFNNELGSMRNELKTGDKVMTDTGVIGEVVSSYEEEGYKYFVLKTGDDKHVGFFTVHANAIYYVFGKEEADKKAEPKVEEPKPEVETTETTETEPKHKNKK